MKKILSLLILNILFTQLNSQTTITPSPSTFPAMCPNQAYVFSYTIPQGCESFDYNFQKVSGSFSLSVNKGQKEITINPQDVPQNIKFKFDPLSTSCGIEDQPFTIPVKSVKGLVPTISGGSNTLSTGKAHTFELTAHLAIPYRRGSDPTEADFYEWEISSGGQGWESIEYTNTSNSVNKKAEFTTDVCNGATIRVRAQPLIECGGTPSNWTEYIVNRTVTQACPISGPSTVICGSTSDLIYSIQKVPNVSGYTYEWTLPNGWTGTPNNAIGDVITVTPNGTSAGTISVLTKSCGMQSSACSMNIEMQSVDPSTIITGANPVCEGIYKTFSLSPAPHSSTSTTWSISPSYLAYPSSGSGHSAFFRGTSISGNGTLQFSVTGCGDTEILPKTINFNDPVINVTGTSGQQTYGDNYNVCPTSGSHSVTVSLINDSNNCVDLWDDHGTAGSDWSNCTQYNFTLKYNGSKYPPYDPVVLDIHASNTSCGGDSKTLYFTPSYSACGGGWRLIASPNPAKENIDVKLLYQEKGKSVEVDIDKLQVIDKQANVRLSVNARSTMNRVRINHLEKGLYYLRATIGDVTVVEPLLIQ